MRVDPKSDVIGISIRRKCGYRHTGPCEDRGRDWNDASTSQGMPRLASNLQKLRRVKEGVFPRALIYVLLSHPGCGLG